MVSKKLAVWLMSVLTSLSWAQTSSTILESASGRIEVLGQNYATAPAISTRQSRIVVYSLGDQRLQGATSIFVNGTYHASLIQGAYSDLCYSPGNVELGARQMQVGQRPKDPPDTITAMQLRGGQTHYLRVREQGGRPVLEPVAAAQAERELPARRLQLHTLSRVAQECIVSSEPTQVTPAEASPHTLAADTLFAFARSDRAGMTALGTRAIDNLVQRLRNDYSRIDRLHIIGHADPLGSYIINERLAIERANTVRQYIETTRLLDVPISAEGRGSREPVLTECSRIDTPQARECNQPNRRVVIEVTGVRR